MRSKIGVDNKGPCHCLKWTNPGLRKGSLVIRSGVLDFGTLPQKRSSALGALVEVSGGVGGWNSRSILAEPSAG